jgi:hypothetical protein
MMIDVTILTRLLRNRQVPPTTAAARPGALWKSAVVLWKIFDVLWKSCGGRRQSRPHPPIQQSGCSGEHPDRATRQTMAA